MYRLMQSEYYKIPKITFFLTIIISVIITELLAIGLYFYNLHSSNLDSSANVFLIYGITWFILAFYILFGVFSSYIVSSEYENKMWSVLLISKQSILQFIFVKYLMLLSLMFLFTLVFAIAHFGISYTIIGESPNIHIYLYILFSVFLGTLAMQSIQFLLSLIIENKVYIVGISIFISLLYLLMQSNSMPFKIPEYIINSENIIKTSYVHMFDLNFLIYSFYSFILFIVFIFLTYLYIIRKDF